MRIVPIVLAALAPAVPVIAGQVWVVGPAPTQQHDLQDTIILARAGDVILVKQGTYESIRTLGRGVSIIADVGASVQLSGGVRVIDQSADDVVVVSGISAHGVQAPTVEGARCGAYVARSTGPVVFQDCAFSGLSYGLYAEDCAALMLVRTTAHGDDLHSATGAYVDEGSSVSFCQVNVTGGSGPAATPGYGLGDGWPGGLGLWCNAPATGAPLLIFISGSTFQGGAGSAATYAVGIGASSCGYGGWGGTGIGASNFSNGQMHVLSVTSAGGAGGAGAVFPWIANCVYFPGPPGQPYWMINPITLAGLPRTASGGRIVRDNASLTLSFGGMPGEKVEVAVTRARPTFTYQASNAGVLHVRGPIWRTIGVVPSGGVLQWTIAMPDLPLSDPGATYFVQARFRDIATGQIRLSNLHAVVEVDASY